MRSDSILIIANMYAIAAVISGNEYLMWIGLAWVGFYLLGALIKKPPTNE